MRARNARPGEPDDENPEWTVKRIARAKSLANAIPEMAEEIRRTGRPRIANPKVQVSIRLDPHVLAGYRAYGSGWQTRVNEVLAKGLQPKRAKRA